MPWCEPCDAFYNPNTLRADGRCPRCGTQVGDPAGVTADPDQRPGSHEPASQPSPDRQLAGPEGHDELVDDEELVAKVPWHFWVGVVAMVVYLGWRFLQGIIWIF